MLAVSAICAILVAGASIALTRGTDIGDVAVVWWLVAAGLLSLHVTGALTIWWLLLVVFLYGVLETVYDGAIRAATPSLVGRGDLPRANSRIASVESGLISPVGQ